MGAEADLSRDPDPRRLVKWPKRAGLVLIAKPRAAQSQPHGEPELDVGRPDEVALDPSSEERIHHELAIEAVARESSAFTRHHADIDAGARGESPAAPLRAGCTAGKRARDPADRGPPRAVRGARLGVAGTAELDPPAPR